MKQYYNISIYCNIYYSNTIQYSLKEISIYCTLQYIVIYCNVYCPNVINTQLLHHKIDWTWIIHFSFSYFYTVIQGVYSFLYCQNPYSHVKCLFTKIQSNIAIWQYIAIHSNTIRNTALTHIVSPLIHTHTYIYIIYIYIYIYIIYIYIYILCIQQYSCHIS